MHTIRTAILSTLLYANLFDCALTKEELFLKLQVKKVISIDKFQEELLQLIHDREIVKHREFYSLNTRPDLCALRRKRLSFSQQKKKRFEHYLKFLKFLPWIQAVYITGSVAAGNSRENDDIDVLIITDNNRLWLSRLWVMAIAELMGVRRKPETMHVNNTWCINIFLEEQSLTIPKRNRNLYTAHELIQAQPMWSRSGNSRILTDANPWILSYLPHAFTLSVNSLPITQQGSRRTHPQIALDVNSYLNSLSYRIQKWHMHKRKTNEYITKTEAYFHPNQKSSQVLETFTSGKKSIGLI